MSEQPEIHERVKTVLDAYGVKPDVKFERAYGMEVLRITFQQGGRAFCLEQLREMGRHLIAKLHVGGRHVVSGTFPAVAGRLNGLLSGKDKNESDKLLEHLQQTATKLFEDKDGWILWGMPGTNAIIRCSIDPLLPVLITTFHGEGIRQHKTTPKAFIERVRKLVGTGDIKCSSPS